MKSYFITIPFFVILAGVVFHLVIPGILAVLVGMFFFVLTVGEIIVILLETTGFFIYLQCTQAFVSSGFYSLTAALLFYIVKSKWVYPAVIVSAFAVHYVFFGFSVAGYYLLYSKEIFFGILKYSFIITTIVAPLLGIIAIVLKKTSDVLEPNDRYKTV